MRNLWELKGINEDVIFRKLAQIKVHNEPYEAAKSSHAVAILTEWDEFRTYDWSEINSILMKPTRVFDGRNILKEKYVFKNIG